jgi:hypothetical protein
MCLNGTMPSRASKKPKNDEVRSAFDTLQRIIEKHDPEPGGVPDAAELKKAAATMSRAGASKGGQVRATNLTAKRRAEIAKKAAAARWGQK